MTPEFGDREFAWFIKVWFTVYSSLTYCYFIPINIPKGFPRLISFLPFIYIFILLPLNLSSLHLSVAAGFCISWLANFKLILLSFDAGPLYLIYHFFIFLPSVLYQSTLNNQNPLQILSTLQLSVQCFKRLCFSVSRPIVTRSFSNSFWTPVCWILFPHNYKPNFMVISFLYLFHLCFMLEPILVISSSLARLLFDLNVEPPFGNCVLLSTSFHDFRGRRWNFMVSNILKSIVYRPVRRVFDKSWGYIHCHNSYIFRVGRKQPCWDVLCYLILPGICLAMEIKAKRFLNGKWQLNPLISAPLLYVFILSSDSWLLFPAFE
ncbi:hypothetical protein MKX01_041539 [Papaver californicum]|nr:hypothetical protein MKX01_041539 [Papaver californicum]